MRFGDKARAYAERANLQKRIARWCAEWIESEVADLSAVEFGAGPGVFTRFLAQSEFYKLTATDVSKRMVEEGRKRVEFADWQVADAWEPSVDSADRIYSCSLLQWADDPGSVLKDWRSLLNSDGRLLVALFIEGSMEELLRVAPEIGAFSWRSEQQWRSLFETSGFRTLRAETRKDTFEYENALSALKSLHAIGAVKERRFRSGRLREILKRVDCAYSEKGYVPLTWRTLRIELLAV